MLLCVQAKLTAKPNVNDLIQAQIDKLKTKTVSDSFDDVIDYRSQLDADRRKSSKSSGTAPTNRLYSEMVASGLNPSVASMMFQDDNEDDESNSDGERSSRKSGKKRKRKEKKKSTKSDKKRSKSEKKSKKAKKEKSKKKRRHDSDDESSSSSSSDSDSSDDER